MLAINSNSCIKRSIISDLKLVSLWTSISKAMSENIYFQTCFQTGWLLCYQPMRSQICEFLLKGINFNTELSSIRGPWWKQSKHDTVFHWYIHGSYNICLEFAGDTSGHIILLIVTFVILQHCGHTPYISLSDVICHMTQSSTPCRDRFVYVPS